MTDEEMAEEYEEVQDYCGLLDVLSEEQYNQDYGGLSCYISPYIEQAFLAGLKTKVKELSTETLLKELIDRKVIRSWYYNGTYHVGNELPKGE